MSDPSPKFRVVDENEGSSDEFVRLHKDSVTIEQVVRVEAEKVEVAGGEDGEASEGEISRTHEPGPEAILEREEMQETVETSWGEDEVVVRKIPIGWKLVIAATITAGAFWAVTQLQRGEAVVAQVQEEARQTTESNAAKDQKAEDFVIRVEETVRKYLSATTVEEIAPLVRHPDHVVPLIKEAWEREPRLPMELVRIRQMNPRSINNHEFWLLQVDVADGPVQSLAVERTAQDQTLVDWETHVIYQPMKWEDFVSERPSDAAYEFRVWLLPDIHYSHEFSDQRRWRAYHISAKDSREHLFAYAPVGSELANFIDNAIRSLPRQPIPLLARIRFPLGGKAPRGVVIEKIIEPHWMRIENPAGDGS